MVDDTGRQIVRLSNVVGRDNLVNDIFFSSIGGDPKLNIIFFGGDIQVHILAYCAFFRKIRYDCCVFIIKL